jgi:maltose alpha-D-glucosyltransferase/alpha-amylase
MSKTPWYKNAIIYGINLPTFQDSNGDGVGDFRGLTSRLDYLADLGVTCLWLLPFYPSPRRDNGYDVSNYYGIDPKFGTFDDFRDFVKEAHQRALRVVVDLVVHHTSDRHPWFEAARSDRKSRFRDYYIWADKLPKSETEQSFFPEVESGVWRYDALSKSYYHHGFYHYQPDLNFANPRVQHEVYEIVDFWLALGVDGFRLDAANHILGQKGLPHTAVPDPQEFWRRIRQYVDERKPEAVMLAEADMDMTEIDDYIQGGKGIHMLLNFWFNQTISYALATGEVKPLMRVLERLPTMPRGSQYVNFLRNLDELNVVLEKGNLTEAQQQAVYDALGPTEKMQVYGRGIRRRLAPMLGGDEARIKLAFSILFAMPGAPMFAYGDEIGMGDNLEMPERDSVRTPMQWANVEQGGFSLAPSGSILQRFVQDPRYHFSRVNVADQLEDEQSLLNFVKKLIRVRKLCAMIGEMEFVPVASSHGQMLGVRYANGQRLVVLHNLGAEAVTVQLEDTGLLAGLTEILSDREYARPQAGELELAGYGFRWFSSKHFERRLN